MALWIPGTAVPANARKGTIPDFQLLKKRLAEAFKPKTLATNRNLFPLLKSLIDALEEKAAGADSARLHRRQEPMLNDGERWQLKVIARLFRRETSEIGKALENASLKDGQRLELNARKSMINETGAVVENALIGEEGLARALGQTTPQLTFATQQGLTEGLIAEIHG